MNTQNSDMAAQKIRGNLAYQQRQAMRQGYLEKKRALRKIFQIGKLVEKVGFANEDMTVMYGLLLEAKEKLLSAETEHIREIWRAKGNRAL